MLKEFLSIDEQIAKLSKIEKLANAAVASDNIIQRIGVVTVYAGLVDFFTFQLARLIEQVILKAQLADGKQPKFSPNPDWYFYDKQINSRRILNEIKHRLLPFKEVGSSTSVDAQKANSLAYELIEKTSKFLNYRNTLIHHIGNPKITFNNLDELIDKSILAYKEFLIAHRFFFEMMQPYRFSEKEYQYFYGNK